MLPTPSTSHIPANVYEPAEDSFLLLDALSSAEETAFLTARFSQQNPSRPPLVVEIGPGSGIVLAFLTANAAALFGTDILTLGVDVSRFACRATRETVHVNVTSTSTRASSNDIENDNDSSLLQRHGAGSKQLASALFLDAVQGDLAGPLLGGAVDMLVFNPPYVPSEDVPKVPAENADGDGSSQTSASATVTAAQREAEWQRDSTLLALATDGGADGMEVTNRLLASLEDLLDAERGVAYVLLCAQNWPEQVKQRLRAELGARWDIRTVASSGKTGGWEKLQIVRISRLETG